MNKLAPEEQNFASVVRNEADEAAPSVLTHPTVLVATAEPGICASMRELLSMYPLKTVWARGVGEVKAAIAREPVAACFCGFWLIDGTYRDVVRHLRRQPVEIPAIIVCSPSCPQEYRDYLAALNLRAFDFLCHPYRKMDLERILHAAISERKRSAGSTQNISNVAVPPQELRSAS